MQVTSPTYLLSNSYKSASTSGEIEIQHMDLYRLSGKPKELIPLNLDHVFKNSIALIEWPQRLINVELPSNRLEIVIKIQSQQDEGDGIDGNEMNQVRRAMLTPYGQSWKDRLSQLLEQGLLDDLIE